MKHRGAVFGGLRGAVAAHWAELVAGADHALLTGETATAFRLLARAAGR